LKKNRRFEQSENIPGGSKNLRAKEEGKKKETKKTLVVITACEEKGAPIQKVGHLVTGQRPGEKAKKCGQGGGEKPKAAPEREKGILKKEGRKSFRD